MLERAVWKANQIVPISINLKLKNFNPYIDLDTLNNWISQYLCVFLLHIGSCDRTDDSAIKATAAVK